jgi:hypothetical protein
MLITGVFLYTKGYAVVRPEADDQTLWHAGQQGLLLRYRDIPATL